MRELGIGKVEFDDLGELGSYTDKEWSRSGGDDDDGGIPEVEDMDSEEEEEHMGMEKMEEVGTGLDLEEGIQFRRDSVKEEEEEEEHIDSGYCFYYYYYPSLSLSLYIKEMQNVP